MKTIAAMGLAVLASVLVACGSSSSDDAGQVLTVPCANGHAVQSFPGESWEEIEATVWLVGALPAKPPAGFSLPNHLYALDDASTGVDATVTDGRVDIVCGTTFTGPGQPAPVTSIELYERP